MLFHLCLARAFLSNNSTGDVTTLYDVIIKFLSNVKFYRSEFAVQRVSFSVRSLSVVTMPPKSRKKRLSEERARIAREGKKAKIEESALEQGATAQTSSASATTTATADPPAVDPEESDRSDATFDPEQDATSSTEVILEQFVEDWLLTLDRDGVVSLSLFLQYHLKSLLSLSTTSAAEYTAI